MDATDITRACQIACTILDSQSKLPSKAAKAFQPMELSKLETAMLFVGPSDRIDWGPRVNTHMRLAIPQASPRNPKTPYNMEEQQKIFEAAEAKRQRKQQARIIESGGSISEEL